MLLVDGGRESRMMYTNKHVEKLDGYFRNSAGDSKSELMDWVKCGERSLYISLCVCV